MRWILALAIAWTAHADTLNIKQATMLQTLQQVISIFSEEYAPFEWKVKSEQFDLAAEIKRIRAKIESSPDITESEFQDLLTDLIQATRDFHVSIHFYSTEEARLPFQVMGSGDRYFIVFVDRKKVPAGSLPGLEIGNEVLEFGTVPIVAAIRALIPTRFKDPTPTDMRNAELLLTARRRAYGVKVPSGDIVVKVKTKAGKVLEVPLAWEYTPEFVQKDIPIRNMLFGPGHSDNSIRGEVKTAVAVPPPEKSKPEDVQYEIGGRSPVPDLGVQLGTVNTNYNAGYLFRLPNGRVVGFVRIATFSIDKIPEALEEFGNMMNTFMDKTDALVIDVSHNSGGDVGYMYGLLSRLTDQPLEPLPHQIMISNKMAFDSAQRLVAAPWIRDEETAKNYIDANFPGLAAGFVGLQSVLNNDRFIISELKAGRRLTHPTYLWGVNRIVPHPTLRYTKPLLVIVDELDFSAGDFFPAILQDNHRATIFGARTAGAGGATKVMELPNQFNIQALTYTWTIAQRLDGSALENVGVTPDIRYDISVKDLSDGFQEYKQAIVKAVEDKLLEEKK